MGPRHDTRARTKDKTRQDKIILYRAHRRGTQGPLSVTAEAAVMGKVRLERPQPRGMDDDGPASCSCLLTRDTWRYK